MTDMLRCLQQPVLGTQQVGPITSAGTSFDMEFSILSGLVNTAFAIEQQLKFTCPSGDCKWATYSSLAVCSACADITDKLGSTQQSYTGIASLTSAYNPGIATFDNCQNSLQSQTPACARHATRFTLPNGHYIENVNDLNLSSENGTLVPILMTWRTSTMFNESIAFPDNDLLFLSATIINASSDGVWPHVPIVAKECALYYCVNNYNNSVVNGSMVEMMQQDESAVRSPDSFQPVYSEGNEAEVYSSNRTMSLNLHNNDTLNFAPYFAVQSRTDLMIGDGYNISYESVMGISSYLQLLLAQTGPGLNGTVNGAVVGPSNSSSARVYYPESIEFLYESADADVLFSALARSMSNAIRGGADVDKAGLVSTPAQVGSPVSYYRIRWPWIITPIILVVAGFLDLWLVSRRSKLEGVPLWKSCMIATLTRGPSVQEQLKGAVATSDLHARAEKIYVRLLDSDRLSMPSPSLMSKKGSNSDISVTASLL